MVSRLYFGPLSCFLVCFELSVSFNKQVRFGSKMLETFAEDKHFWIFQSTFCETACKVQVCVFFFCFSCHVDFEVCRTKQRQIQTRRRLQRLGLCHAGDFPTSHSELRLLLADEKGQIVVQPKSRVGHSASQGLLYPVVIFPGIILSLTILDPYFCDAESTLARSPY